MEIPTLKAKLLMVCPTRTQVHPVWLDSLNMCKADRARLWEHMGSLLEDLKGVGWYPLVVLGSCRGVKRWWAPNGGHPDIYLAEGHTLRCHPLGD